MTEELLYYIWHQRMFNATELMTTTGEPLVILHTGVRNHDSGPDFTNARVRISGDVLAGNVEIHVRSSDWIKHGHHNDKAYSNLILHVVYEDDHAAKLPFATLELKDKIDGQFISRYRQLMSSASWIPCETQINGVDSLYIKSGLHRVLVERMEQKTAAVIERLEQNKNSWEEAFYQITARNFGLKINAEPFESLARSLPLKVIAKHKNSLQQIEALLFGQAGLLEKSFKDDYPDMLKKEYRFLRKKYDLHPVPGHLWKFMRLRPPAFPTVRIAQFSMLLHRAVHLFSKILEAQNAKEVAELFEIEPSEYWLTHYRFDTPSPSRSKKTGDDFISTLIINAVIPVTFSFGKSRGNTTVSDRALRFLEEMSSEKNSIIAKWESLGVSSDSAYDSQSLLQLKNGYCNNKKCLNCHIGSKLLKA